MKKVMLVVRTLMGALFLFASITFLFKMITPPPLPAGPMKTFVDGMEASGYMMRLVKTIELLCGLAFVTGYFVPLATVVIAPIIVNIVLVHALMAPEGIGPAIFLVFSNAFVAWYHRDAYKPLLKP